MTFGTDLYDRVAPALSSFRGTLEADFPLAPVVWFRAGGCAELLAMPKDVEDLQTLMRNVPSDVPVHVIGLGSNLLVRDGGIPGLVVRLSAKGFSNLSIEPDGRIRVGTAMADKRLAAHALKEGLGGFAFYHGIPGGLGGALRMNAGANGSETRERVVEVKAVDRDGELRTLSLADMGYSYRHSAAAGDLIFVEALFQGEPRGEEEIKREMAAVQEHRETVQPIKSRTGGSTFKNPEGNSAWKLIDAAGCRGLKIGNAQVSELHCNFLINTGGATGHDLELLGETVRSRVLDSSGVRLEWEIRRFGRFEPGRGVEPFLGQ